MIKLIERKTASCPIDKYKTVTPPVYRKALKLSKNMKNLTVFHINSTPVGGGVAELLQSQIPLERSLGIDSRWFYIQAPRDFFKITKQIHNLLQGKQGLLTKKEKDCYIKQSELLGASLGKIIQKKKPDIIVIHDPQPLLLVEFIKNNITAILRIHLDLSSPNKDTLNFLKPFIQKYKQVIFTHKKYSPKWLPKNKIKISAPAIDPFTEKNSTLSKQKAGKILRGYKIDTRRPIVAQVARFDPWKDPVGAIDAYRLAKKKIPGLQLVFAGFFSAKDDAGTIKVYEKVKKYAAGDPDIFLFADLKQLEPKHLNNEVFINAIYTASDVIIHKSIKEGFGMIITEAMWKKKPVIGGKTDGIALQIQNGKNGFMTTSAKEAGRLIVQLIENPKLAKKIGQKAHETVKNKFLMSKLILDYLEVYAKHTD